MPLFVRSTKGTFGLLTALLMCLSAVNAQQAALSPIPGLTAAATAETVLTEEPPAWPITPATILSRFVVAETQFRETLNRYTFTREVILQTIGAKGEVTGEYIRNSQFVFDDQGRRIERIIYHPKPTIHEMKITKEDIQDLAGAQLFGFEVSNLNSYKLTFVAKELLDSREMYVIDISPIKRPDPHRMSERFFNGRIWVDPVTFQVVKMRGIAEPRGKQRFPFFETRREPLTGSLLFPARTSADDILHFPKRDVHYQIKVRYYDYKRFTGNVRIVDVD